MTNFVILIDGEKALLSDFVQANEGEIAPEELEAVKNLKLGESTAVGIGGGFMEITRFDPRRIQSPDATRNAIRRIVEAKERLGAANATEYRAGYERAKARWA